MIRILSTLVFSLSLAIQADADTNRISLNVQNSSAKVRTADKTYNGDLGGLLMSASFDFGERFSLGLEVKDGSGKVSSDKSVNYSFNEYLVHSAFKFGGASGPNVQRNYSFSIGFGILNKNVKFNGLKLNETQYPLFLGVGYELSENLSIRASGYSQIDKFDDNRAAFIELAWPVTEKIKVVGRYSNYSSEINKIKHCGSDYVIGLETSF